MIRYSLGLFLIGSVSIFGHVNLEREVKNLIRPVGHVYDDLRESLGRAFSKPSRRMHYVQADTLWDSSVARGNIFRTEMAASLPDRSALDRKIQVYYPPTGRITRCTVRDIGPWFVRDPYWSEQRRPRAHSNPENLAGQKITYPSGISLTPQVWYRLGIRRDIAFKRGHQATVGWRFLD